LAADQPAAAEAAKPAKKKILMYSFSQGFRHSCVTRPLTGEASFAEKALKEFGEKAGYEILVSQDANDINHISNWKHYDAVIFYTTGIPLYRAIQREGMLEWLRNGGALIGIHCATDTFHTTFKEDIPTEGDTKCTAVLPDWPDYVKIMGAAFQTHHKQAVTAIKIDDPDHPAVKGIIPQDWKVMDEIYLFHRMNKDAHLLLSADTEKMDEQTLTDLGMKKGDLYPISWTNTEGKGRVFYTSLGHREDVWTNPIWQKHLINGIAWALKETDKDKNAKPAAAGEAAKETVKETAKEAVKKAPEKK